MRTLPFPNSVSQIDNWPDSRPLPWVIDLAEWLRLSGYGLSERQRILTSLLDHGTFCQAAECGLLDREDYPLVEAIYVESQPPVDWDDPAWGPPIGEPGDELWQLGPPPAVQTGGTGPDWKNWEALINSGNLPPICGGAPEQPPVPDVFERMAQAAEKIISLQAQLAAVPADWRDNYYPF